MSPVSLRRSRFSTLLLWAAPLTWLGCGGDGGTDIVLPSLSVTTTTDGVELDPDGYSLVIDGSPNQPIGLAATLVIERLADGQHLVELSGLAANCAPAEANPQTVTVRSGATASVAFQVRCSATSGSIEVATSTSGTSMDPDGFILVLDAAPRGPIGTAETASVPGVTPGAHSIGLTGLAANCQVNGENPRSVAVAPGQIVEVPFTVTCTDAGPSPGSLTVTTATTGTDQDPDGYGIALDGGASQPIGANASITLPNLPSSAHRVELTGVAPNCKVGGSNPRSVSVGPGQAATVEFAITCESSAPAPGSLRVNVNTTGDSQDNAYSVTLDGGTPQTLSGSRTIENLAAGQHSVLLGDVAANCTVSGANPQTVTVAAGQMANASFQVSCVSTAPAVNLRIQRISLTQSTQDAEGKVPLVQSRDGYLRVFVTATGNNNVAASVRVRFSRNGALVQSLTIPAPSATTPSAIQEATLQSSWNARIPGSLIQPNTSVLAEVDPDNTVAESNENDNSFPASGNGQDLPVQSVPPAIIRLVPIRQTADGSQGRVSNPDEFLDLTRRMHPLGTVVTETRQPFTVDGPLQALDDNGQWNQVLTDLEALRIADNATDRTYYGVVHLSYQSGLVGNGFVGAPSAIGWDDPVDGKRVIAHELGHTWGQLHTPCGSPSGVDPNYPYRSGNIGVYGFDLGSGTLEVPTVPDIMGYCDRPWISDYIYQGVMNYRRSHPLTADAQLAQPCVLVWGRVVNGQAILEPGFQIVTRPKLPKAGGPYTIDARGADGSNLFTLSFDAVSTGDDKQGGKYFAFAVPIDQARAARLGSLRLSGPGIQLAAVNQTREQFRRGAAPDNITVQGEPGAVALRWNAAVHPMLMVRDPDTGEVLAFARGGNARVWTGKRAVDLEVSNGVQSQRLRLAISR